MDIYFKEEMISTREIYQPSLEVVNDSTVNFIEAGCFCKSIGYVKGVVHIVPHIPCSVTEFYIR